MLSIRNGAGLSRLGVATFLAVAGLTVSCAASGTESQKQSNELGATMETYGKQAETAIMDLKGTLEAHEVLVDNPTGDLVKTYDTFAKGVKKSAQSFDDLTKTGAKMAELAQGRFDEWETRLASFSSESMAERSKNQLDATREKFEAVVSSGEEMMAAYKPLLDMLQGHSEYMALDLSPASTAALQEDTEDITEMRDKLAATIDDLVAATKDFVDTTKLVVPEPEPAASSGS